MTTRIVRNDWSRVTPPELGAWRPERTVSVIIPAYDCQSSLDLTLASLSRQTYPAELLEVVVVDDGSQPPIELPPVRPARTRLIRAAEVSAGWGRANALHVGATHSTGDILHWLDADMVAYPEHVEAQARWHHLLPYAVTLGYKRFIDTAPDQPDWPTPQAVVDAGTAADRLFGGRAGQPHDYVEEYIDRTDQLRSADHLAYMIHAGATAALRRELYEAAGGLDVELRLGEDTEFGYRLAQAGAVFVPEPAARSWHLGASHVMRAQQQVQRYNHPFLADRMPQPRWLRKVGGSGWAVPLVGAVLPVDGQPLERVRVAVDALLAADQPDLVIHLVAPWDKLTDGRRRVLADPLLELRLIAASYRSDPRVRLVNEPPESVFPAPYLLELAATDALAPHALRRLIELAERDQVGLVRVELDGRPGPRLWRTAALGRARWVRTDGEPLADTVTEVYGARDVAADTVGVLDLTGFAPTDLAAGVGDLSDPALRAGPWIPNSVEVAGVRSLARATMVVGVLLRRRLSARVRQRIRPPAPPATGPAPAANPGRPA